MLNGEKMNLLKDVTCIKRKHKICHIKYNENF